MGGLDLFVCCRPIAVPEGPVQINGDGTGPAPASLRWMLDPASGCAVESALRLREAGEVERVVCLTVGPVEYESALAWSLAAGADRALRVSLAPDSRLDARATASLLASALRRAGARLVVTGQRSGDEQNGLVAAALAADLGAAYLGNAVALRVRDGEVLVQRRIERGHRQLWAADLPAVVAVEPGANRPRYVSVASIAMAGRHVLEVVTPDDLAVETDALPRLCERVRLARGRVRARRSSVPGAGGSAAERLQAAMGTGSPGGGSNILRGNVDELVDRAVEFMQQRGVLRRESRGRALEGATLATPLR
jgi:electron transfer flavoprotein beta subunit